MNPDPRADTLAPNPPLVALGDISVTRLVEDPRDRLGDALRVLFANENRALAIQVIHVVDIVPPVGGGVRRSAGGVSSSEACPGSDRSGSSYEHQQAFVPPSAQVMTSTERSALNTINRMSARPDGVPMAWEPTSCWPWRCRGLRRPSRPLVRCWPGIRRHRRPRSRTRRQAWSSGTTAISPRRSRSCRNARRFARTAGNLDRESDILASLGVAWLLAGQTRRGLSVLDAALGRSRGVPAGQILIRRAYALWVLGRQRRGPAGRPGRRRPAVRRGRSGLGSACPAPPGSDALRRGRYRAGRPGLRPGRDAVGRSVASIWSTRPCARNAA